MRRNPKSPAAKRASQSKAPRRSGRTPQAEGSAGHPAVKQASQAKARASSRTPKDASQSKAPRAPQDGERLHVRIARSGVCSRRAAEELIRQGRVFVNGDLVTVMGLKVTEADEVAVDGVVIAIAKNYTVVLYKPKGCVTTLRDPQGRPTIIRHLPDLGVPLKPVGRLDMDTEGLLVCTNDGELANRLAHPRYGVEKEYQAIVEGTPDEKALGKLRKGVWIEEGGKTAPAKVEVISGSRPSKSPERAGNSRTSALTITIHEGRKRQVRLMCEAVGHPVVSLKRIRYGPLRIKGMRAGEARMLGKQEVDELKKLVGLL